MESEADPLKEQIFMYQGVMKIVHDKEWWKDYPVDPSPQYFSTMTFQQGKWPVSESWPSFLKYNPPEDFLITWKDS